MKIEVLQPKISFETKNENLSLSTTQPKIVFGQEQTTPEFKVLQPRISFSSEGIPAPVPNVPAILAGEDISALKCIRGDADGKVYVCTNEDAFAMIGVTLTSAIATTLISFRTNGLIEDSSWNWLENLPIYCGAAGVLTQTPPVTGYICWVGIPVSPSKMIVNLNNVIKLI